MPHYYDPFLLINSQVRFCKIKCGFLENIKIDSLKTFQKCSAQVLLNQLFQIDLYNFPNACKQRQNIRKIF